MNPPDHVEEQIDYYRARAPHYEDWWFRRGVHDFGPEFEKAWSAEVAGLDEWFDSLPLEGATILELAGGTGVWTSKLARVASHLTVVDSSPEALDINRRRRGSARVGFVEANIFEWEPGRTFDRVFFSFWLSHVPESRFAEFWDLVRRCLNPGGMAVLIDNAHPEFAAGSGPPEVSDPSAVTRPTGTVADLDGGLSLRAVEDGRSFTIVKRYWLIDDLTARLANLGWAAQLGHTRWAFIRGTAQFHDDQTEDET